MPRIKKSLWHDAFCITDNDIFAFATQSNVLDASNVNLLMAEQELLLWHHRLSHARLPWLQPLMQTKKWLTVDHSSESLHQGPFLPCRNTRTGSCKLTGLRCAACLASKASTQSAGARHESHNTPSRPHLKKLSERINGEREKKLKRGDIRRGDGVPADHYISAVLVILSTLMGMKSKDIHVVLSLLIMPHSKSSIFANTQQLHLRQ